MLKILVRWLGKPQDYWAAEELARLVPCWVRASCPTCRQQQLWVTSGQLWCHNPECRDPAAAQRKLWAEPSARENLAEALRTGQVKAGKR